MAYAAELDKLLYQMQNFLVLCFLFAVLVHVLVLLLVLSLQIFPVLALLQTFPVPVLSPVLILLQALPVLTLSPVLVLLL